MRKLRAGVIGLGEVAQIIHLPILESLGELYEMTAFCDVSPGLLQWAGKRYGVERLYEDAHELAKDPNIDVVFVLNSSEFHADNAIAAMEQKKHVFIEKPMTLTIEDADAIIEARDHAGVKAMVGYMRRYAPAFTQAVDEIQHLGPIQYAVVRGIIGYNHFFIDQTSKVQRFRDMPADAMEKRKELNQQKIRQALGDVPQAIRQAYGLLLGLGSHDLSAMRELIGMPNRVVSAVQWKEGSYMTATLEYDGFYATYETGIDQLRRFDAHIEVFGAAKQMKVQYNTPYIRHLPTTLHVAETAGEAYLEQVHRPTFKDAYTVELEHFHNTIVSEQTPKTTPEDYKQDLQLFTMITERLLDTHKSRG